MPRPTLKSYEFRREREKAWLALERIVDRAEAKGLRALSEHDLMQLPTLYRAALSSLNVARSISLDRALLEYLEALCQRAYFVVYGTRRNLRDVLGEFFLRRLPRTIRTYAPHLAVSIALLLLGTLAGYLLTSSNQDRYYAFISPDMAQGRDPGASTADLRASLYDTGDENRMLPTFAAFLFSHNAKVGMLCFALGFVAGIPVFLLLFMNGLLLGAMTALYASRGLAVDWWGWVLPHGVTELLAVAVCGAAGLVLGQSLVFPGTSTRLENLARRGKEAGVLLVGAIVMLFFAALLEGFFRQMVTDIGVRYAVIAATTVLWIAYFGWVGRRREA